MNAPLPVTPKSVALSVSDTPRIVKAIATNLLAWAAPRTYLRLTNQTGRGEAEGETVADIASYFWMSFEDYFRIRGVDGPGVPTFLNGKVLLEYGPGDLPGVAALMLANGAHRVYCVDRFPMVRLSPKNCEVLLALMARLDTEQRIRLNACLIDPARPELGFQPDRLTYIVTPDGCSGLRNQVDFIYSRAVLEHVNDLSATFRDMRSALKEGGIGLHLVDLRSHGLHRQHPLDFLVWPSWLWGLMYSEKGVPNRHRLGAYQSAAQAAGLMTLDLKVTHELSHDGVDGVRSDLAAPFRSLGVTELACLGFWMHLRKV